jgi:hypothetical protein
MQAVGVLSVVMVCFTTRQKPKKDVVTGGAIEHPWPQPACSKPPAILPNFSSILSAMITPEMCSALPRCLVAMSVGIPRTVDQLVSDAEQRQTNLH